MSLGVITTLVKGGTPPEHVARVQSTLPADGAAPLKIAMVAPPYFDVPPQAYGGIEAVLADLSNALVDLGHTVTMIGAGRDGTKARFWQVWERAVPARFRDVASEAASSHLRYRRTRGTARETT